MPPQRKPWPMKWIALAVFLYIAGYTAVDLRYRKPGPEFQPYEQARERAGLARAGFAHIPAKAERPADPRFPDRGAAFALAAGGIPPALAAALAEHILLPIEIGPVSAAAEANRYLAYEIQFTCILPDNRRELGGGEIFLKDREIVIVPDVERLPGGLLTRARENVILLTVPAGALPAGRYRVTLVGERASKAWPLTVR